MSVAQKLLGGSAQLDSVTHSAVETLEANDDDSTSSSLSSALDNVLANFIGSTQTDIATINSLSVLPPTQRAYMAGISPTFFTHYGADSFDKNVCFFLFPSSA